MIIAEQMQTITWVNRPGNSPIVCSEALMPLEKFVDTIDKGKRVDVTVDEYKPLICKCCGAPINRKTMICEYCGVQYRKERG